MGSAGKTNVNKGLTAIAFSGLMVKFGGRLKIIKKLT
jgi:hypothetical protein